MSMLVAKDGWVVDVSGMGAVSFDDMLEAIKPHNPQEGETWLVHISGRTITGVERKDDDGTPG